MLGYLRDQYLGAQPEHTRNRQPRATNGKRLRASLYGRPPGWTGSKRNHQQAPDWLTAAGLKLLAAGGLAMITFLATSQAYINFAAELPDARGLGAVPLAQDTLVYASDGTTLLADLHDPGHQRYYEPLSSMGTYLQEATIAIEDANFYHEPGIDAGGIVRAAWVDWREHRTAQGASTITQQLVKLRLIGSKPTLDRKVKEAFLAVQVERTFSKQQILEMYLNTVFYGNDAYGSAAASAIYFHTQSSKLTLGQATMLAGIPQNPTFNNPLVNPKGAKARQRAVLDAMLRERVITQEEADKAFAEDLGAPDHLFRPENRILAPGFVGFVQDQLAAKYGAAAVRTGGYRVTTTLDWNLQQLAQKAVTDQVNSEGARRNFSQGALVSIDPGTGAILAMVGSANPAGDYGQGNMATAVRNPGSSMKIYNYTAAIESTRFTMVTPIYDGPMRINLPGVPRDWPKNYDLGYHGTCQLRQCMGNSLNIPAVKVEIGVGIPAVVEMARKMGAPPFDENGRQDGPPDGFGYSLTLGGYGETVLQMATGASVLASQGVLRSPYGVQQVSTADGGVIAKADSKQTEKRVLDPKVAFIMQTIMSDDDNRAMIFGRGSPLTLPGRRVAAKTGTTDSFTDGWTLGYTPALATAVWMGNPKNTPMTPGSDGVFVAAPAWHNFMQSALDQLKKGDEWYGEPPGLSREGWGKPVYLLPGTTSWQKAPQLPSYVQASGPPSPSPSPSPNP